jgi:hypothetical protein
MYITPKGLVQNTTTLLLLKLYVEIKVVQSGNLKLYEELFYIVLKTNIR